MFRCTILFLSLFPVSAFAAGLGTVTADLGGEAKTWHTLGEERDGQPVASATFDERDAFTMLHIQAHPEERFTTNDVMSVDLMWMGRFEPGKAPVSVDLMYMPSGMRGPFWTSEDAPQPARATFDISIDGTTGRVTGSFSGMLCLKEGVATPVDTTTCKAVSGQVDTDLLVE